MAAGLAGASSWAGATTKQYDTTIQSETHSRCKLAIERDLSEFITRMCRVDRNGMIEKALDGTEIQAIDIIRDSWSWPAYWAEGRSTQVEQTLAEVAKAARTARKSGHLRDYLHVLLWRIKHWRNQVVHGGVTHRSNPSVESIRRCVEVLENLLPAMIRTMGENTAKPPAMT